MAPAIGPGPSDGLWDPPAELSPAPQPGFLTPGQGVNGLAKGTAVPTFLSSSRDPGRQRCGA